jgi:hypothetical protein
MALRKLEKFRRIRNGEAKSNYRLHWTKRRHILSRVSHKAEIRL